MLLLCSIFLVAAACGGDSGSTTIDDAGSEGSATQTSTTETAPAATASEETAAPDVADSGDLGFSAQLTAGSCFDDEFDADGDYDTSGDPLFVDCAGPHDNEVVSTGELDDGPEADYPTGDEWQAFFDEVCEPAIADFLGADEPPPGLLRYMLGPEEAKWDEGDRSAACIVALADAPLAGSAAGLGDAIRPASFPSDAPEPAGITISGSDTIENSYSPSESFVDDLGIDVDGFVGATFEAGPVGATKADLEAAIAGSQWAITDEYQWRGDNETAYYALSQGDRRMIVEIWHLESDNARIHYFYRPDPPLDR